MIAKLTLVDYAGEMLPLCQIFSVGQIYPLEIESYMNNSNWEDYDHTFPLPAEQPPLRDDNGVQMWCVTVDDSPVQRVHRGWVVHEDKAVFDQFLNRSRMLFAREVMGRIRSRDAPYWGVDRARKRRYITPGVMEYWVKTYPR
jgi:hypothetical protein